MKRMFKNLFLILLIGSVPLSMAFSQEKKTEKKVKVVIDDGSGTRKVEKTIVIKDGEIITKEGDEKFDVYVGYDEGTDTDVTKYIIAEDGVVVTIESNDEAKAKELIKEIESKLGVKSEGGEKKEVVKTETKKK